MNILGININKNITIRTGFSQSRVEYPIRSESPGLCLLINNMKFKNMPDRPGSETTAERFKDFFQTFDFFVLQAENLSVQGMKEEIAEAVKHDKIQETSSFALVILSYGFEGIIYGTNSPRQSERNGEPEEYLTYKEIVKLLNNKKCAALMNKPKIFFFVTGKDDEGKLEMDGKEIYGETVGQLRHPKASEILMSFAVSKEVDPDAAETYASILLDVLEDNAHTCDLEEMLKIVEKKVRSQPDLRLSTSVKMIGWSRNFYFLPFQFIFENQERTARGTMNTKRSNVYPISPARRGLCLIINNMSFCHEKDRVGSEKDADTFKSIFQDDFGFEVYDKLDQRVQEMRSAIRQYVNYGNNSYTSCFVLIILSHGTEVGICGVEYDDERKPGEVLSYNEIVLLLDDQNCKALTNIPKICFFQACHGGKISKAIGDRCQDAEIGTTMTVENVQQDPASNIMISSAADEDPATKAKGSNNKQDKAGTSKTTENVKLAPASNILFSYAAQEEFNTWRHTKVGGLYAVNLAKVLRRHAKTSDVEEILKILEKEIRNDKNLPPFMPEACMSTSVRLIGWSSNFYFFPGPEDSDQRSATFPASSIEANPESAVTLTKENIGGKLLVLGSTTPEVLSSNQKQWLLTEGSCLTRYHQGICNSSGPIYVFNEDIICTWTPSASLFRVTNLPKENSLYASAVVGENIYIMGGLISGKDSNECHLFNRRTTKLMDFEDMSTETSGRTAVVLRDKIYITPGTKDQELGQLDELDPKTNKWKTNIGSPMNFSRCGHGIAACQSHIWVFGGISKGSVCNYVEKFDLETENWELKPPMPTARRNLSVTFFEGQFYAIGGSDAEENDLAVVEIFDPNTEKWKLGPSLCRARSGHMSIAFL